MNNCQIIDQNENIINEFTIGSGYRDIQTNNNHELWVSYGDTAIYFLEHNDIAKGGLNCFNLNGEIIYKYDGKITIDQCERLNVYSDNEVFLEIYSGSLNTWYGFVKIVNKKVEIITEQKPYVKALAFYDNFILVRGSSTGYSLLDTNDNFKEIQSFEFYNNNNEKIWLWRANREALFFCSDKMLYKLNFSELIKRI
jgi:hypothetical protein